jgi:hypothetical protein
MRSDAHLVALTIEHDATLCITDRGLARFRGCGFRIPAPNDPSNKLLLGLDTPRVSVALPLAAQATVPAF